MQVMKCNHNLAKRRLAVSHREYCISSLQWSLICTYIVFLYRYKMYIISILHNSIPILTLAVPFSVAEQEV
jgi:hypothetical protein